MACEWSPKIISIFKNSDTSKHRFGIFSNRLLEKKNKEFLLLIFNLEPYFTNKAQKGKVSY